MNWQLVKAEREVVRLRAELEQERQRVRELLEGRDYEGWTNRVREAEARAEAAEEEYERYRGAANLRLTELAARIKELEGALEKVMVAERNERQLRRLREDGWT